MGGDLARTRKVHKRRYLLLYRRHLAVHHDLAPPHRRQSPDFTEERSEGTHCRSGNTQPPGVVSVHGESTMSWESRRRSWNAAMADGPVEDRGVYHLDRRVVDSSPVIRPGSGTSESIPDLQQHVISEPVGSSPTPMLPPEPRQNKSAAQAPSPTAEPRPSTPRHAPPSAAPSAPPAAKPVGAEVPSATGDPSSDDYYEGAARRVYVQACKRASTCAYVRT